MLRLALLQLDLTVGAVGANADRVAEACAEAARQDVDLVLAPELAISGYPPEDLLFRSAFLRACRREVESLAGRIDVPLLVGSPWLGRDRVHNSALLLAGGEIKARYDKQHLPNYGVFDEERTFAPGRHGLALRGRRRALRGHDLRGPVAVRRPGRPSGTGRRDGDPEHLRRRRTTSARPACARTCCARGPATSSRSSPT